MPRRLAGDRQHPVDKIIGRVRVKPVRHRADEINGGLLATERLAEALLVQGQREPPRVAWRGYRLQPRAIASA